MGYLKFFVCACLLSLLSGCATLQRPEPPGIAVTSIKLGQAQGINQPIVFGLNITNPNRAPLNIQGMKYQLSLNGYDLLEGVSNNIPVVEGYGQAQLELTAYTKIINALRFVNNVLQGSGSQNVNYTLHATVDLGGLLGV